MTAIISCGVAVGTLNIFRNARRCSVPSRNIPAQMRSMKEARITKRSLFKNLASDCSTKVEADSEKRAAANTQVDQLPQAYPGIDIWSVDSWLEETTLNLLLKTVLPVLRGYEDSFQFSNRSTLSFSVHCKVSQQFTIDYLLGPRTRP